MNKRISQFDIVDTLEPGDLIPIVNQNVTKKTQLSAINNIPITFAKETFLPFTGGTVTGNLQIDNDLHVKDDITVNDIATIVNLVSTSKHGTSLNWGNTYTTVTQSSGTWATGGTIVQSNSAKWQSTYTTVYTNSSKWENAYKILEDNAYVWSNTLGGTGTFGYIPKFLDVTEIGNSGIYENIATNVGIGITTPLDAKLTVNGKIKGLGDLEILGHSTLSSAHVRGSMRIDGVLSALGGTVNITTRVSEASSLRIYNIGTGPALSVTQIGAQDVATFSDENGPIMCITDAGNVGIGPSPCSTDTTVKLDVKGPVRIGGAKIRDWASTTDIELENTKPGVTGTGSSQFGTILEGANNGHVLIGIRSNDANDGFAIVSKGSSSGYPSTSVYDKNCFTVLNTGKVGINVRKPTQELHVNGTYLQTVDGNGDYVIRVQDGNGRVNHYWNTLGTTTPTFLKGGESATRWLLGGQDQNPFEVFISQNGATAGAGDAIIWTKLFTINRSTQYIGAGVDNPFRHLHIANRVNGSTEVIIEQTEAAVNYKKWNFVVDGGNASTGGGVGSRFYVRQLNDLGTGGNIPVFFAPNGKIGINNEFAPAEALDVSGNIKMGNVLTMGKGANTVGDDVAIEIGQHRTADGEAFVDFHSAPGTDYESRLIRQPGLNGDFVLENRGTGILRVSQVNASSLYLQTSNTKRVEVDSDGNVGVNTLGTIPEKLTVIGNMFIGGDAALNYIRFSGTYGDGDNHTVIAERVYNGIESSELVLSKGNDISGTNGPDRIRLHAGAIAFDIHSGIGHTSDLNTFLTAGTTKMYIGSNGNVGIGSAFPGANLASPINPTTNLHINDAGYGSIMLGNNNSTGFHITKETTDNSFNIWTGVYSTAPVNRFKIANNGYVGINETTPEAQLHVFTSNQPSFNGPTATTPKLIGTYPPNDEVNHFSAVIQSTMGDSGGLLIIANDNNGDEKAIDIWNEMTGTGTGPEHTAGRKFSVRTSNGDTFIAGRLSVNNDLSLNNANLKQFKVVVKDWQPTTALNNGDEYTLQPSDTGAILHVRGTLATYIIVPTTLPVGFNIMIVNGTTKSCTIQGATGMQVVNVNNKITIGSQNGICNLVVLAANRTLISGDLS